MERNSSTITFTATDPSALSNSDQAAFTVTAINDAPVVLDIPDQTVAEGVAFATINLDNYVTDVDNLASEMTWSYAGNVELSVSIVNRVAIVTAPSPDWNGFETITFTATDPGGLSSFNPAIVPGNGGQRRPGRGGYSQSDRPRRLNLYNHTVSIHMSATLTTSYRK